mmetsp:Transcript_17642/g.40953  ORF Transcript_17642/g.40953 Transcript_17642/m.40953 type:complete len:158 (-) Transcript_17642:347-820(-)
MCNDLSATLNDRHQGTKPPSLLCCPITKRVMEDPVMAVDGHTYERVAIEKRFASCRHPRSPVTGEEMMSRVLLPNIAVRDRCHFFMQCQEKKMLWWYGFCEAAPEEGPWRCAMTASMRWRVPSPTPSMKDPRRRENECATSDVPIRRSDNGGRLISI